MSDNALAWHPEQPHNQLPGLPLAQELETRPVLKACIEARAALAELKHSLEGVYDLRVKAVVLTKSRLQGAISLP